MLECCSAILAGRDQIALASDQVRHAAEAYRLTNLRLEDMLVPAPSVMSSRAFACWRPADFSDLQAVAAYDKAEVRLLILLGFPRWRAPH